MWTTASERFADNCDLRVSGYMDPLENLEYMNMNIPDIEKPVLVGELTIRNPIWPGNQYHDYWPEII